MQVFKSWMQYKNRLEIGDPASLGICCLLDKPERREVPIDDYAAERSLTCSLRDMG
jgi:hypothetical protein